ncbi:hypothetical protein BDQ17DRAFT_1427755 [Cyathus striatus]|nr:hypothetical protein BDQ17DRAFT_1427755 [Cyathus striatus]
MSKSTSTSNSVNPSMVEPRSSRSSTRVASVASKTQEISEGGTNTPSELSEMPKTVRPSSRVASRAQVQSGGGTITPSEPSEMPKTVRSSYRVASRAQVKSGGGTITPSEPSEKPKSMRSSTRIAANKAQEQSGGKDTPHEPTNMSKSLKSKTQTPGSDLASVLEIIAEYWELVSDKNSPISTLDWKQKNNKYIVEILADGAVDQQILGPSSTVNKSSSSKSKSESGMRNSDIIQLLINHFEIPKHLQNVDKKKDSIKMTYLKYCKINEILSKEMELASLGEIAHCHIDRKLIIAVFMASSTYYQYPFKIFPMLSYDPAMESWFEEDEPDKDHTKAVWEGLKPNFSNLQKLLEGKKAAMDYRAKQKEREESEKEKEKSKKSHQKGKSKKL